MKAATAFLFLLKLDPFWYYYLITFNPSIIAGLSDCAWTASKDSLIQTQIVVRASQG
jgi:hypothetical protein